MSSNPNVVYLPTITVTPDGTEDKGPFEKAVDSYVDGATEFYETYNDKYTEKLAEGIADAQAQVEALDYVASQHADAAYDSLQQSLAAGDSEAAAKHQADYDYHSDIRDIARDSTKSSEQALFDIKKESAQKILDTFGDNKFLEAAGKYGGPLGDAVELGKGVYDAYNGDAGALAEAMASIPAGTFGAWVGGSLVGFATTGPLGIAIGAAAGAILAGIALGLLDESVWDELAESFADFGTWIGEYLAKLFNDFDPSGAFGVAKQQGSPIVIDLDGDGVETLSQQEGVYFDLDNNGMAEKTGWAGQDDGLLVLDRNNNGNIDNGSELFGNHTELNDGTLANNGYEALAELDENADGLIDSQDASYAQLQIWQDTDNDGITDAGELTSLSDAGITAINTNYNQTNIDSNGNTIKQTSTATLSDGSTVDTADVWFGVNKTDTVDRNQVELTEDILLLPDAAGFGNVRSLRQAMVGNQVLQSLVIQFTNANTSAERLGLMDSIIYQWTDSQDVDPNSYDEYGSVYMDGRRVAVLEQLIGREYLNNVNENHVQGPQAASYLEAEYVKFSNYVYAQLMSQTAYQDFFTNISITYNSNTDSLEPDLSSFIDNLKASVTTDEEDVEGALTTFKVLSSYSSVLKAELNVLKFDEILGTYILDTFVEGTDSDDTLQGGSSDDLLEGGLGDDTLYGGNGDDVYKYNSGDGSDVIFDALGNDAIQFGEGISQSSILVSRDATRLFIDILDNQGEVTGDKMEIRNVFDFTSGEIMSSAIETFAFSDNSQLSLQQLLSQKLPQVSTDSDDVIYGYNTNEVLSGLGGNDTINAVGGNDTIHGGSGDDDIQGGGGNDSITGGLGNDVIDGGTGNDTYIFNLGDGSDVIKDSSGTDTLSFGEGISTSDIKVTRTMTTLFITILDDNGQPTDDKIQINNTFNSQGYITDPPIDIFNFASGESLSLGALLDTHYQFESTDGDDLLFGTTTNDDIDGQAGNDHIHGYGGEDILNGGEGRDHIYGGAGNDSLSGGNGNDYLYGDEGDDTIFGGLGSDSIYGGGGNDIIDTGGTDEDPGSDFVNAGGGDDTIIIGAGDAYIRGGGGNDTYIIQRSTSPSHVRIFNHDADNEATTDTLIFEDSISPNEVSLERENVNLKIRYGLSQTNVITLQGFFWGQSSSSIKDESLIHTLQFSDGTIWDLSTIQSKLVNFTDGDDEVLGYSTSDVFFAQDGNDSLNGQAGDDYLYGQAGNDELLGGEGDDILVGGEGKDTLNGGLGSDVYIYNRGDGVDTILSPSDDILRFGAGILPEHISIHRMLPPPNHVDYEIAIIIDGDVSSRITVKNSSLTEIQFDNGQGAVWSSQDISNATQIGTQNTLTGTSSDDIYTVDHTYDEIEDPSGIDVDTVHSSVSYVLPDNVENLTLTGVLNSYAYGNSSNNILIGNDSDNVFKGGGGQDISYGGLGDDIYYNDTQAVEYADEGIDTRVSASGWTLGENIENLIMDVPYESGPNWSVMGIGNALDNLIVGRSSGINGDILDGREGADTMVAVGAGDVIFYVDNVNDKVLRESYGIDDEVRTTVNYEIPDFVKTITLLGDDEISAIGNDLDNILDGSQNSAANVLDGGYGDDSYIIGVGDTVIETQDGGIDRIYITDGPGEFNLEATNIENVTIEDSAHTYNAVGTEVNNILVGNKYTNALYGGAGDDILAGGDGNDDLYGEAGNDSLRGGAHSDRYHFEQGWGHDVIEFEDDNSLNTIIFGNGISRNDLSFSQDGDDMIISDQTSANTIRVESWFTLNAYSAFQIEFEDGTVLKPDDSDTSVLNASPVITAELEDAVANEDEYFTHSISPSIFIDQDMDNLQFVATTDPYNNTLPSWLSFDSETLTFYGTPTNDDVGDVSIYLEVSDSRGGSVIQNFNINVSNINDAPEINGSLEDQVKLAGEQFTQVISPSLFTDEDAGDELTYSVTSQDGSPIPDWLSFDPVTGELSGTPPTTGLGDYILRVAATDNDGASSYIDFNLSVVDVIWNEIDGTSSSEQLLGTNDSDLISGLDGDDDLYGFSGNDRLVGGTGSDWLVGGNGGGTNSGDDELFGGEGNDTLYGEDGDDFLDGGNGNDHYYYYSGGGQDVISDAGDGQDILFFNNVEPSRLTYHQDGDDLIVLVDGDLEQQVRVINHFLGENHAIMVQPNGGYTQTPTDIANQLTDLPTGNEGGEDPQEDPEAPSGTSGRNLNLDFTGDDVLLGTALNEVIASGAGNDELHGLDGNDRLIGGEGDDTYVINAGEGHDVIVDTDGTNIIHFSGGLTFNDVASGLMKSGNDLILNISASDTVRVAQFFSHANTIEKMIFDNGSELTASQLYSAFAQPEPTEVAANGELVLGDGRDNSISGTANNDVLLSGQGEDTLEGLEGDDQLIGGAGDDTYVFGTDNGQDTIIDTDGVNVISFVDGIGFNDVASGLMRSGDDLILNVGASGDSVTVSQFFSVANTIDRIEFENGSQMTAGQLYGAFGVSAPTAELVIEDALSHVIGGSENADTLTGSDTNDMISGYGGDDLISGGLGNDTLDGGDGNDRFLFGLGDGEDTIIQEDTNASDLFDDVLAFDSGITHDELWFSRQGDDLQINIEGTDDQVTISNWYSSDHHQLDKFETDSMGLMNQQLDQLVSAMANYDVPKGAGNVIPQDVKDSLQPVLASSWTN